MIDPQAPRNVWRKAVIEKVFAGKDGQVRVELRTATGTFNHGVRYLLRYAIVKCKTLRFCTEGESCKKRYIVQFFC